MKFRRISLSFALALLALPLHAATPAEQAVLAPIQSLFDAMAKREATAIQQPLMPGGTIVLMREGKPTQLTFPEFAARVAKPSKTKIEERIHDPVIHIDNDLAVVWAPFDFLSDGKINHCGTDLFNLVRKDGNWLIISIADTDHATCPAT